MTKTLLKFIAAVTFLAACHTTVSAKEINPFGETQIKISNSTFDQGKTGWQAYGDVSKQSLDTEPGRPTVLKMESGSSIERSFKVSRGMVEHQGRRCIVRVKAKVVGEAWLSLRLRGGTGYRDVVLRQPDQWQTITAILETPNYLPGADDTSVTITLKLTGRGHAYLDDVRASSTSPYGLTARMTVLSPKDETFTPSIHIIRHHRDTGHPDGVRHQYFSGITPKGEKMRAGKPTGWIDLRRYLFGPKRATVSFAANINADQRAEKIKLRIELAIPQEKKQTGKDKPDPLMNLEDDFGDISLEDEKPLEPIVIRTIEAVADRGVVTLLLPENNVPPEDFVEHIDTIASDIVRRTAWIEERYPQPAALPLRIPIAANISAMRDLLTNEELAAEAGILRRIGITAVSRGMDTVDQQAIDEARADAFGDQPFKDRIYRRLGEDDKVSPYDGDRLAKLVDAKYQAVADQLKQSDEVKNVALLELLDEPHELPLFEVDVVAFRAFLKERGVTPQDVGSKSWDEVRPWGLPKPGDEKAIETPDVAARVNVRNDEAAAMELEEAPDEPEVEIETADRTASLETRKLLYYTRVFIAERTADYFLTATKAVRSKLPDVHTSVNFRAGLRRVLTAETADWFAFGRKRAVTMMWNEDWLNTYGWRNNGIQLVSYYTELMRTSARKHDLPHGCFCIVMGHALEKGYSAIAHGARRISFWRYGPAYANYLPYSWSHSQSAVTDIATFTRDVATIEDMLVDSKRHNAKVALLYAKADPVWGHDQTENRLVSFALLHDQIPFEIITEDEVEQDEILKQFDTVYVTDHCIRRATQAKLADWFKQGNSIWLSGDAATRDEFHEPCGLIRDAMGVTENNLSQASDEPFTQGKVGDARFRVMHIRPGEEYEKPVRAMFNRTSGKGRLQTGWQTDIRQTITSFVADDIATRPMRVSEPCVEAILYHHADRSLLFLINYTGKQSPLELTVTLRNRGDLQAVRSLRHGDRPLSRDGDDATTKVTLDRTDVLIFDR